MTVITKKTLDEVLDYLDKVITKLAKDSFENVEFDGDVNKVIIFLENQFDIRLENILAAKNSGIHHLESGMKNNAIQKKREILEKISKQYTN